MYFTYYPGPGQRRTAGTYRIHLISREFRRRVPVTGSCYRFRLISRQFRYPDRISGSGCRFLYGSGLRFWPYVTRTGYGLGSGRFRLDMASGSGRFCKSCGADISSSNMTRKYSGISFLMSPQFWA